MDRQAINRIAAATPIAMSLLALGLVLFAVSAGWQTPDADEGAAAHAFQLLIVAQAPFILAYLVTADWNRWGQAARAAALQAGAIALAFAPVAYFHL